MSEQDKVGKKSGITRREFLKKAGLASGGVVVSSSAVLSACDATKETIKTVEVPGPVQIKEVQVPGPVQIKEVPGPVQIKEVQVPGPVQVKEVPYKAPLAVGYLVHDTVKCCNCKTCMYVCSVANEGVANAAFGRRQSQHSSFVKGPEDVAHADCRQCVYPTCVEACPSAAFFCDTANGNTRTVDRAKCAAYQKSIAPKVCKACIDACPYLPSRVAWITTPAVTALGATGVAAVCDLCKSAPNWAGGGVNGTQACVTMCTMNAIQMVKVVPSQLDDVGYNVNLRTANWNATQRSATEMNDPNRMEVTSTVRNEIGQGVYRPQGGGKYGTTAGSFPVPPPYMAAAAPFPGPGPAP